MARAQDTSGSHYRRNKEIEVRRQKAEVRFSVLCLLFSVFCLLATPAAHAQERRTPVVIAVEKVSPAVVNINTEEVIRQRANPFTGLGDEFFDQFFQDFFPPQDYKRQSLGSGVIINQKGYILTNEHVISRASTIKITLNDNREFDAHLVGADSRSDLAIIKIDSDKPLPFAQMGASADIMIGESVIAIGNPFGLSHTVTTGIVSAVNRNIKGEDGRIYSDFIQIDASINPGNSGGPLLNINGEVIGINSAIYQKAEGIGFAIPIDRAKRIVNDLIKYGEVHEAWLGIFVQELTPQIAKSFGYSNTKGVIISKAFKGGPSDRAGLKRGDIIISIGNKPIRTIDDYYDLIYGYGHNDKISITVFRDGEKVAVNVTAQAIPEELSDEIALEWLGIAVNEITNKAVKKYQLFTNSGVLISKVEKESPAGKIGIEAGDVLRQINQAKVETLKDFKKAVISAKKGSSVLLLIQRGKYGYYVTLEP
ncbi:MAG: Do family serine endopeptidase [Nitrospinae bacterium]|nr:Do family serine endopeptidase [Nitrospinota bacterium]